MPCSLARADGIDPIVLPSPLAPLGRSRELVGSERVTLAGFGVSSRVRVRRVWRPAWVRLPGEVVRALEARYDGADGPGPWLWTVVGDDPTLVLFRGLATPMVAAGQYDVSATLAEVLHAGDQWRVPGGDHPG